MKLSTPIFSFLIAALVGVKSYAADFSVIPKSGDPEEFARFKMTGPISPGDVDRLVALLDQELQDYYWDTHYVTLTLDSPGGSFNEALKLMDLLKERQIGTRIQEDASCMSACAVAFMGGSRVVANMFRMSRIVEPGGRLGFHAPSLNIGGEAMVPAQLLQNSYESALSAISGILDRRERFEIQTSLVEKIIETPPSEMFIVETVDDFARWDIAVEMDQSNWEPDANDVARMCLNQAMWTYGSGIAESDLNKSSGVPPHSERVKEWASRVNFYEPPDQKGIRSVFAYASDTGMTTSTCVVQLVDFQGKWHPSVYWSQVDPETAVRIASKTESEYRTYMLHALPFDFPVANLR